MSIKHTWIALVGVTLLAAVANQSGLSATPDNPDRKAMENEQQLTLKVGEVRLVTLQSRGAVGLQLIGRSDDESISQVERKEYRPSDVAKQMPDNVGGPVPAIFAIKALREGETQVTFAETRPWDKTFKEIIQKQIRITVKGR